MKSHTNNVTRLRSSNIKLLQECHDDYEMQSPRRSSAGTVSMGDLSPLEEDGGDDVPANDRELAEEMWDHLDYADEAVAEHFEARFAQDEPAEELEVEDGEPLPPVIDAAVEGEPEIPPMDERVPGGRREEEYMRRYHEERQRRLFDWGQREEAPREPRVRREPEWPALLPGHFAFRNVTLDRFLVRYRNFQNELAEFEGNRLSVTGVPRFPFHHLRALIPSRTCICFQLGPQFRHARRWFMVQVDMNVDVSLVSQHMLRSDIVTNPVTPRRISLRYRGCEEVIVSQTTMVTLLGKNNTHFEMCVGVVSDFSNPTFDFKRMIVGRTIASQIMVGLDHAPPNRPRADGQIILSDDSHPARFFVTTYETRRNMD